MVVCVRVVDRVMFVDAVAVVVIVVVVVTVVVEVVVEELGMMLISCALTATAVAMPSNILMYL